MDKFVQNVSVDTCTGLFGAPGLTMGYFDGNTVTGLWNYAQNFALSDNFFGTRLRAVDARARSTWSPATPTAFSQVDARHRRPADHGLPALVSTPTPAASASMINDPDPCYDDCSDKSHTATNNLAAVHRAQHR